MIVLQSKEDQVFQVAEEELQEEEEEAEVDLEAENKKMMVESQSYKKSEHITMYILIFNKFKK